MNNSVTAIGVDAAEKSDLIQPPSVTDPQLEEADRLGVTWEFEGQKYAKFVANRTGTIGSTLVRNGKPFAILEADFMWTELEPFLSHLDLKLKDVRNTRNPDETERQRANMTYQNQKLFEDLVQRGRLTTIAEDGERSEPQERNREQMLRYAPEVQSVLIDDWLGQFHIERYFPSKYADEIDSLLSEPEYIWLKASIGNFASPAHLLIFQFATPSREARRAYETNTFGVGEKMEGDNRVTTYHINANAKVKYAKKYLRGVQGALLGPDGVLDLDTDMLMPIESEGSNADFRTFFNPHWFIRLADELNGCFNFAGK